ncbi:CWC16 protein [Boeremia exigua]|uniref:CWC16 protein n=1 Tax=Boeremia exigua TaxID=749465 RepID=UPI001E8E1748|nr:CWC16 protein [Boeremia exigua]KAH6629133.1 CWC16 protein [Boeremia exigua]
MQGFNMGRYYPPDASNAPTFNKSHPLGARANKISQGILTVRFELPFAVWCQHCKPEAIVGQGVRFNAAKKKVGNFYSTPIWSFRVKHTACGGEWEIRTDPKTTQYLCVEGCRKRDYGPEDVEREGELGMMGEAERAKRRDDAFAGLEGKLEDKARDKGNKERVEELYEQAETWRDPYDVNARLRRDMREKRKVWKKEERHKEGMQEKFSLGLDIEDETDADRQKAGLIEFGGAEDVVESWKPLFASAHAERTGDVSSKPRTKKLKAELAAEKSRNDLQQKLVGNTRAVVDPFVSREATSKSRPNLGLLKRKRSVEAAPTAQTTLLKPSPGDDIAAPAHSLAALVGYDSD